METLEEIKEDFAKSRGHVSWKAYLERGSTFGGEIAVDLLDFTYSEIAHSYADQFKSKWISVEEMTADTTDNILMLFDDDSVRRHEEDWPFATATHFFVLPSSPERKEAGL